MDPQDVSLGHYVRGLVNSAIKPLAAFIAAAAAAYWNAAPQALRAALVGVLSLAAADTLLGALRALVERRFSASCLGRALVKAAVYLLSLLAAYGVDSALGLNAGAQLAVALMMCLREASSVVETSAVLGFPWPRALVERLQAAQQRLDSTGHCDIPGGEE